MISLYRKSLGILQKDEQRNFLRQAFLNTIISLADIAALAGMVLVLAVYAAGEKPSLLQLFPVSFSDPASPVLIIAFFILFLCKSIAGYFITRAQFNYVYGVAGRLSLSQLSRYLDGSYTDYLHSDSSVTIRRISQSANEFCQHILAGFLQVITQCLLVVLAAAAIIIFNPSLFILLFIILLPPVTLLSFLLRKKLKDAREMIKTSGEKSMQYLREAMDGYVESNIYHGKDFFTARYKRHRNRMNNFLAHVQILQGSTSRLVEVFAVAGLTLMVIANLSGSNALGLVNLSAFLAAAYKIIPGIVKILNHAAQIRSYAFTLDELEKVSLQNNELQPSLSIRSLVAEDVSFSYGNKQVLQNISLSIQPGDMLGISGPSGAGKTSLVNILLGFLEPASGAVYVNGKPVNKNINRQLWQSISYVKQQPFLLHQSIAANISFSNNNNDKEKIQAAMKAAAVDYFTQHMDEGAETIVKEKGLNISGGQQQRINIARALYKLSDLYILDEPFSDLDDETTGRLLQHCRSLAENGKMLVIVSHQQKILQHCNKLLYLDL